MAMGNEIVVSSEPRGRHSEGIASGVLRPGMCVQIKANTEPVGGAFTYEAYNASADGQRQPVIVVVNDYLNGKTVNDAYADGQRVLLFHPVSGDEMNMLLGDVSGTADAHQIGEMLMIDDGTGELVATTGTPEDECFQLLETVAAPTADTLAHCLRV